MTYHFVVAVTVAGVSLGVAARHATFAVWADYPVMPEIIGVADSGFVAALGSAEVAFAVL